MFQGCNHYSEWLFKSSKSGKKNQVLWGYEPRTSKEAGAATSPTCRSVRISIFFRSEMLELLGSFGEMIPHPHGACRVFYAWIQAALFICRSGCPTQVGRGQVSQCRHSSDLDTEINAGCRSLKILFGSTSVRYTRLHECLNRLRYMGNIHEPAVFFALSKFGYAMKFPAVQARPWLWLPRSTGPSTNGYQWYV